MPACIAASTSSLELLPVSAKIGTLLASGRGSWRICRAASQPSSSGICTSISTICTLPSGLAANLSTASRPLQAATTSSPFIVKSSVIISMLISLSSATSTLQPTKSFSLGASFNWGLGCSGASKKGKEIITQVPSSTLLEM